MGLRQNGFYWKGFAQNAFQQNSYKQSSFVEKVIYCAEGAALERFSDIFGKFRRFI